MAQDIPDPLLRDPKRRDAITRRLGDEGGLTEPLIELPDDGRLFGHQTSSGLRNTVAILRSVRFKSRWLGLGVFSMPWGPTIQLNGRLSVPMACWSSIRPSSNASGRGGQPGT